jgi:hypothetical protein
MADTTKSGEQAADKAEATSASRTAAAKAAGAKTTQDATTPAAPAEGEQRIAGDASQNTSTQVRGDVTVTEGGSAPFSTKPGDVPVDPRSGQPFADSNSQGLKGTHGEEVLGTGMVVPGVDPDRIPAEVTPGVSPDAGGDRLLAAAQAKAPSLTREFVQKMGLDDETLGQIARGEIPPPPTPGPIYTADMYRTPGGYQQTPPGVPPEDVGKNATTR